MMSLFSSFDLFFWKFILFIFFPLILLFAMQEIKLISLIKCFFKDLISFLLVYLSTMKMNKFKFMDCFIISIMFSILILNYLSILPYYFSFTSQMSIFLSISLSLVLGINLLMLIWNIKGFISHFIPCGAPLGLCLFLFVIEIISSLIRPITLVVRLMSNILSGHLLLILLSKMVSLYGSFFLFYILLTGVEMFVALIQAYIFGVLSILYISETA